ncbi:MAG: AAA family ATPase [Candidatus Colwellbacteria bacterium]
MSNKEKPIIVCLLGIHTSGKTTIGKALQSLGLPYYPEIGNELIKTVDFNSPEKVAWFDGEIMKREIKRDDSFLSEGVDAAVVETWHIGNIAYAQIRTPSVANAYKEVLKERLNKYDPAFFFLDINEETFKERANKLVPLGIEEDVFIFYKNIRNNILSLLEEYQIAYHRIDANQEVEEVLEDIRGILLNKKLPIKSST